MVEIYCSTDIEADGPIPARNSMLSFATAAFRADKTMVDTFSANLIQLPGATQDPDTMKWWEQHREAYEASRKNLEMPEAAMKRYVAWLGKLPGKPVFVGYPAGFDFLFVYWYLVRFTGGSPFSFSALDIKTFAMAMLKLPYRDVSKRSMPRRWFEPKAKHTHVAIDDAVEQGLLFCNMHAERQAQTGDQQALRDSLRNELATVRDTLAKTERERDALKKAKTENDDRFMTERDQWRERAEAAERKLQERG